MANQKISALTALTTPASADVFPIVDDSEASVEKTKKITFANLLAAITGAGKSYTITGAYLAYMPTNGVGANAVFMLGNSSTVLWMYLNTAPPGWKALSTGADTVLGVSGGSGYFNVNGGNPDALSSWAISGLSHSHYHTGPSHVHDLGSHTHAVSGTSASGGAHSHSLAAGTQLSPSTDMSLSTSTDTAAAHTHSISFTSGASSGNTGYAGTGATSDAVGTIVSSSGIWRPKASIGKLFQLDTA